GAARAQSWPKRGGTSRGYASCGRLLVSERTEICFEFKNPGSEKSETKPQTILAWPSDLAAWSSSSYPRADLACASAIGSSRRQEHGVRSAAFRDNEGFEFGHCDRFRYRPDHDHDPRRPISDSARHDPRWAEGVRFQHS